MFTSKKAFIFRLAKFIIVAIVAVFLIFLIKNGWDVGAAMNDLASLLKFSKEAA